MKKYLFLFSLTGLLAACGESNNSPASDSGTDSGTDAQVQDSSIGDGASDASINPNATLVCEYALRCNLPINGTMPVTSLNACLTSDYPQGIAALRPTCASVESLFVAYANCATSKACPSDDGPAVGCEAESMALIRCLSPDASVSDASVSDAGASDAAADAQ